MLTAIQLWLWHHQAALVPLFAAIAWSLVAIVVRSTWAIARDGTAQVKRLHQIPCAGCVYFSEDYALKCAVRPSDALSEAAINCPDFRPRSS